MGGGVALAAAADGLDADALVLAGPAIAGADAMNPLARAGARVIAGVAARERWTGRGLVDIQVTDNLDALHRAAPTRATSVTRPAANSTAWCCLMDRAAAAAPTRPPRRPSR